MAVARTTYTFTGRALSLAGEGPPSTPSNAVTPTETVVTGIVISGFRGSGRDVSSVGIRRSQHQCTRDSRPQLRRGLQEQVVGFPAHGIQ